MSTATIRTLDINQIKKIIPHRYPFLLVDRVTEIEPGIRAAGYKNVTANEEFFNGHFPIEPIMPGVLIVEALAQLGCICVLTVEANKGALVLFAAVDGVKFRQKVQPGDRLDMEVEILKMKGQIGKAKAYAKVGDKIACEGEVTFAIYRPQSGDNGREGSPA